MQTFAYGFVYIWHDLTRKKYYIGSHYGAASDGYVCSNKWMLAAYKKRPTDFRRRIIGWLLEDSKEQLLVMEQKWLDLIPDEQLSNSSSVSSNTARYYNHKKLARGGSHKGHKKAVRSSSWNAGTTKEMQQLRRDGQFCFLSDSPKHHASRKRAAKGSWQNNPIPCSRCEKLFQPDRPRRKCCSHHCSYSRPITAEQRALISAGNCGKTPWNKGLNNLTAAQNGRNGASKLSAKVAGRKRQYRDDGSWTWFYPEGLPRP